MEQLPVAIFDLDWVKDCCSVLRYLESSDALPTSSAVIVSITAINPKTILATTDAGVVE